MPCRLCMAWVSAVMVVVRECVRKDAALDLIPDAQGDCQLTFPLSACAHTAPSTYKKGACITTPLLAPAGIPSALHVPWVVVCRGIATCVWPCLKQRHTAAVFCFSNARDDILRLFDLIYVDRRPGVESGVGSHEWPEEQ